MKTALDKAILLGIGLASAGKEQIEKTVEELVKKGQVSRNESSEMIDDLLHRGEEARQQLEQLIQERVQTVLAAKGIATSEDLKSLEDRLRVLEEKIKH